MLGDHGWRILLHVNFRSLFLCLSTQSMLAEPDSHGNKPLELQELVSIAVPCHAIEGIQIACEMNRQQSPEAPSFSRFIFWQ